MSEFLFDVAVGMVAGTVLLIGIAWAGVAVEKHRRRRQ